MSRSGLSKSLQVLACVHYPESKQMAISRDVTVMLSMPLNFFRVNREYGIKKRNLRPLVVFK
jgi:hypothetical protein